MNKKGFISTSLVYSFFLVFVAIVMSVVVIYSQRRLMLVEIKNDIRENMNIKEIVISEHYIVQNVMSNNKLYPYVVPDLTESINEYEWGMYIAEDNDGDTYYFRGDTEENYFKFGKVEIDNTPWYGSYTTYGYKTECPEDEYGNRIMGDIGECDFMAWIESDQRAEWGMYATACELSDKVKCYRELGETKCEEVEPDEEMQTCIKDKMSQCESEGYEGCSVTYGDPAYYCAWDEAVYELPCETYSQSVTNEDGPFESEEDCLMAVSGYDESECYQSESGETVSQDLFWRVIRVNGDGSTRLMLNEPIENESVSYDYISDHLESWYDNINDEYKELITKGDFCTETTSSLQCSDENARDIGLITYNEVVLAGVGEFSYINKDQYYWAMVPQNGSSIFYISSNGSLTSTDETDSNYLFPVINIKAGAALTGTGTKGNPYRICIDENGDTICD